MYYIGNFIEGVSGVDVYLFKILKIGRGGEVYKICPAYRCNNCKVSTTIFGIG